MFDFCGELCYNRCINTERRRFSPCKDLVAIISSASSILSSLKFKQKVIREIAQAVGLKSTSTVHGHLQRLEKRGLLHRDAMKPRAMEVTGDPNFIRNNSTAVPVVGRVTAGQPIFAEENLEEYVPIPDIMLGEGEHFILHVKGDSMIEAGILDGDYIIVRKTSEALNGEIVVAMIDDSATVKRYFKEDGHFRLQPENRTMEPIYADEVTILGKVTSLYRLLK